MSVTTRFIYDDDGNNPVWHVNTFQNVEPEVEFAKDIAKNQHKTDWGRLIGIIPNNILNKWIIEDEVNYLGLSSEDWGRLIKRKLRDPDYAWLRTYSGSI